MSNPADLKYTKEHEWVRVEGNVVTFGITNHAQEALGDVVFVELPEVGQEIKAGETYGTVESVKAVSDLVAAVSGKVIEVNEEVADKPELLNSDPYGAGWLVKLEASDLSELEALMDVQQYEAFLQEEE